MSTVRDLKTVSFSTAGHWACGLGTGTAMAPDDTLVPIRPLASTGNVIPCPHGAFAPAAARDGALYWSDGHARLGWQEPGSCAPCSIAIPGIAHSPRLVFGRRWLWAFVPGSACLARFAAASLREDEMRLLPAMAHIVDLCGDSHDGVWVLLGAGRSANRLWHVDGAGRPGKTWPLPSPARSVCRLGRRLVLLSADGATLTFLDQDAQATGTVALESETPGFVGNRLDSDQRARLMVSAGTATLLLDANGGLVGQISAPAALGPIHGAAAYGSAVWLACAHGLAEFDAVAGPGAPVAHGIYLSPRLHSPDEGDLRGWLRAELSAVVPQGSALSLTVMSTADQHIADKAETIFRDSSRSPAQRQQAIEKLLAPGASAHYAFTAASGAQVAVPLFAHTGRWLWLKIELRGAPDGQMPQVRQLQVLYPDVSLMQNLPAIFQDDPASPLRHIVGVLETTTHELDRTIGGLAGKIAPARAPGAWLDYMARWFDLPWHDALPEPVKRALLVASAQLLAERGTRAGLARLGAIVLPGATLRIVDGNADLGLLTLGGQGCAGAALPAILAGLPPCAAALSRRAVLGRARLAPQHAHTSSTASLVDLVRIEIGADPAMRSAMAPLLKELFNAMLPAGLRLDIRWRHRPPAENSDSITLDDVDIQRLNQGSRLGMTLLGRKSGDLYLD